MKDSADNDTDIWCVQKPRPIVCNNYTIEIIVGWKLPQIVKKLSICEFWLTFPVPLQTWN